MIAERIDTPLSSIQRATADRLIESIEGTVSLVSYGYGSEGAIGMVVRLEGETEGRLAWRLLADGTAQEYHAI